MNRMRPIHPGEVLRMEFGHVDDVPGIAPDRFNALKRAEVSVSRDDAEKLGAALRMTPEFWLSLQEQFDARSA